MAISFDMKYLSLFLMVAFYIFAGTSHFRNPKFFLRITPPWVPYPEKVNIIVGWIEIVLGFLLIPNMTRPFAAWGIILLLIVVFPANIYHYQKAKEKGRLVIPTLIRLFLQPLLIYWAYTFVN